MLKNMWSRMNQEICKEGNSIKRIILFIYTGILFIFSLLNVSNNGFSGDECWTINLAHMTTAEMITVTAQDVHPPLYYMIVRFFYLIFGNSAVLYHMVSLLPYGMLLIFCVIVIRKKFGNIPAAVLVTYLSLFSYALNYNLEVRMYSWANLFVLLTFYYEYQVLNENKTKDWCLFAVFALCAAYTHYYALLAVAFYYIILFVVSLCQKRYLKKIMLTGIVTVAAYLPWFIVLLKSFFRTKEKWWLNEIPKIWNCVYFIFESKWFFLAFLIILFFFLLYETNTVAVKNGGTKHSKVRQITINLQRKQEKVTLNSKMIWILSGIISAVGVVLVGEFLSYTVRPFFLERYLFPVTAVIWLVFGIGINEMKWKKYIFFVIFAAILFHGARAYVYVYNDNRAVHASTADFLKNIEIGKNDYIITDVYVLESSMLEYYYPSTEHCYIFTDKASLYGDSDVMMRLKLKEQKQRLWLWLAQPVNTDMEAFLQESGYQYEPVTLGHLGDSGDIYVYQLVLTEK